jgi:TusE/DsrC/DsvC family sulfur relay protein
MTIATLAGIDVELNDEGFFVDPEQWTTDMVPQLAEEWGVPGPLTEQHWEVLNYMRQEYFDKGTGPTVRKLGKSSGVSVKELYQLFPKGPAKLAARVAGIPKPKGCI